MIEEETAAWVAYFDGGSITDLANALFVHPYVVEGWLANKYEGEHQPKPVALAWRESMGDESYWCKRHFQSAYPTCEECDRECEECEQDPGECDKCGEWR